MAPTKRNKNRSGKQKQKVARSNPLVEKMFTSAKSSRVAGKGKNILMDKKIIRKEKQLYNSFKNAVESDPKLEGFRRKLRDLNMKLDEFLEKIETKKFLTTRYQLKGAINESIILNDKILLSILTERANGSLLALDIATPDELQKAIGNVANMPFSKRSFNAWKTELAVGFKTFPDNKQYLDFSMVRYNPGKRQLFIMIPGEIKEPKAARELAKQFGRFTRRLRGAEEISFQIGKETINVKNTDVFYIKNNSVGIGRTEVKIPKRGKNINEPASALQIKNANFMKDRPENVKSKGQEFIRFKVEIHKDLNPNYLDKQFKRIRRTLLRPNAGITPTPAPLAP